MAAEITVRDLIARLSDLDPDKPVAAQCCVSHGSRHPLTGGIFDGTSGVTLGADEGTDDFASVVASYDEEWDDQSATEMGFFVDSIGRERPQF